MDLEFVNEKATSIRFGQWLQEPLVRSS